MVFSQNELNDNKNYNNSLARPDGFADFWDQDFQVKLTEDIE